MIGFRSRLPGSAPWTISRELARNSGRGAGYRATRDRLSQRELQDLAAAWRDRDVLNRARWLAGCAHPQHVVARFGVLAVDLADPAALPATFRLRRHFADLTTDPPSVRGFRNGYPLFTQYLEGCW
jgi:hypothetical protein